MKAKDFRLLSECVENEGFDYCFTKYSNFDEIKDAEFHRLREAYLEAREAFVEYCQLEDI